MVGIVVTNANSVPTQKGPFLFAILRSMGLLQPMPTRFWHFVAPMSGSPYAPINWQVGTSVLSNPHCKGNPFRF